MGRSGRGRRIGWRLLVLLLSAVLFTGWLAGSYVTDGTAAREILYRLALMYLPDGELWIDQVHVRPFLGQVELRHVVVRQQIAGAPLDTLQIPLVVIRTDLAAALKGNLVPREVLIAQPKIRIKKREDGRLNVQGLLADPWPGPLLAAWPSVQIQRGSLEIQDHTGEVTILHDVNFRLRPFEQGWLELDGEAQGDSLERITYSGWVHGVTGELVITHAGVRGLAVGERLRGRVPEHLRALLAPFEKLECQLDMTCRRLEFRPGVDTIPRYDVDLDVHDGEWAWEEFPFPLNNLSGNLNLRDGQLAIKYMEGHFGNTIVRVLEGTRCDLDRLDQGVWHARVEMIDLELDHRLRDRLPERGKAVWDALAAAGRPGMGRVRVALECGRARPDAEPDLAVQVDCQEVTIQPEAFPYLLERVRGRVSYRDGRIDLDLASVVGGQPLIGKGWIQDPELDPRVHLEMQAGAIPIDNMLLQAMPEDIRNIVLDYQPTGQISGKATITMGPETKGEPRVVAEIDLDGLREMRWVGLPYPVRKVSGHLTLQPDRWIFRDLKAENGLTRLTASGQVDQPGPGQYAVDMRLQARHLKFDRELRSALPKPWQASWGIINPVGSSNVDMRVVIKPGQPDQYHCRITPDEEDETRLMVRLVPIVNGSGQVPKPIVLPPLENLRGTFDFDNGLVRLQDVRFIFREAPVEIERGEVQLSENGAFQLELGGLGFRRLRIDQSLRNIMPEMMGRFAEYLDDGQGFTAQAGRLGITWSGRDDDPAVCVWERAVVEFFDNRIQSGVPLEHLQGRISNISGRSDGRSIAAEGALNLDNIVIQGQQITSLAGPLVVKDGWFRLPDLQAQLLGGVLHGRLGMSFETTPAFEAEIDLKGASLEQYARTLPGKQDFRGLVAASVSLNGRGAESRSLRGRGSVRITEADLGSLPVVIRLIKPLNLSRENPAFDRADLDFSVQDGLVVLDPAKITGNTISLLGRGTISPMGELDARFKPVYGRDERLHIPGISDVTREASGQLLVIHASGPVGSPQFRLEVIPGAQRWAEQFGRWIGQRERDPDIRRPMLPKLRDRGPTANRPR